MAQRKRTPSSLSRQVSTERLSELARAIVSGSATYRELREQLGAEGVHVSSSALKRFGAQATNPTVFRISEATAEVLTWAHKHTSTVAFDLELDPGRPGELRPGPTLRALWAARTESR